MRFTRILPLFRIRNGVAAVRNNTDSIEQAVDVVHDKVGLYLFPEGRHRTKHSLLQLSKGIFHIALDSNREFGKEQPIYIVPVGIEYGDYFRYRSTCMVNFGEAINVTDFINNSTEENEAVLMNQLRGMLWERISKLITYIPDDEDYDAAWEIVKMKNEKRAGGLYKKMLRNRATVDKIQQYKEQNPEEAKNLFSRVMDFAKERVRQKISVTSTAKKYPLLNSVWKFLLALIGLAALRVYLTEPLRRAEKHPDKAVLILLRAVLALLSARGLQRSQNETMHDFARRTDSALRKEKLPSVLPLIDAYASQLYGRRRPNGRDYTGIYRALRGAASPLTRLRLAVGRIFANR